MKSKSMKEELTETIAFTNLPMKWREMCYRFAKKKNIPHDLIVRSKFKIERLTKFVKEIELPE